MILKREIHFNVSEATAALLAKCSLEQLQRWEKSAHLPVLTANSPRPRKIEVFFDEVLILQEVEGRVTFIADYESHLTDKNFLELVFDGIPTTLWCRPTRECVFDRLSLYPQDFVSLFFQSDERYTQSSDPSPRYC